ncbi:hypothetical protein FKW77_008292 [Venturia effusa]|uniref:Uncharacterized protein n=1 Tax=Venturia effusa TaxID=50376 RepID=A0A517LBC1_9PEZI|nr:hypothetical protein FKW77_008292 [Venturia effusa]
MSVSTSTPRKTRASSAPPAQSPSSMIKSFSMKIELCKSNELFVEASSHVPSIAEAKQIPNPCATEADRLESFPQEHLLPAVPAATEVQSFKRELSLVTAPGTTGSNPETANPELEVVHIGILPNHAHSTALTLPHPLSQDDFDAWLERYIPKEEHAAARAGWAFALAGGSHKSLNVQFNGPKAEKVAANHGWKEHHIQVAKSQGREVFYCEKAPECIEDQYLKKDSRPCVSNYFGRNKRNTARISSMVIWCRKHYQRSGYHGRKNPSNNLEWPHEKVGLILEQLRRNEEDYQRSTSGESLTYTVALKASEYKRMCKHNNGDPVAPAKQNGKSFEAPMNILLHIHTKWAGEHRTYDECVALTQWAAAQLDKKTCPDLPLWEMVPEYPDALEEDGDEDEEEDEDEDEDMDDVDEDEDDEGPVTPRKKASSRNATPKKHTPRKSSPKKNVSPKTASPKSAWATRTSPAKKGRVSGHGSIQKPE